MRTSNRSIQKASNSMHKSPSYVKRRKRLRRLEIILAVFVCVAMVLTFAASMS